MSSQFYQPSKKILTKYADVLVNFALNSGKGLQKGEVVRVVVPDVAKAMALALQKAVLQAGGHIVLKLIPTGGFEAQYYDLANRQQLTFFPRKYFKAQVELIDHQIGIIADPDPFELAKSDPNKIILARDSHKKYQDWLFDKENTGHFTWTVGLWGVEAKARIVGLSLKQYWQQIIQACFLDLADPVAKWREVFHLQEKIKQKLNNLKVNYFSIQGKDMDLKVGIANDRVWKGGNGRNIPSFEIFTSPDWRTVNGWIRFNEPVYRYGNLMQDIFLKIENGIVIQAQAKKGNQFLQTMLKSKNANKIGEFSLTDNRMSRITHPMAETLYDENMGGQFGNMHLALGMAYRDCYRGDQSQLKKKDWEKKGFNDSAEHTDIVTTTDRTVTAFLKDGSQKIIYQKGRFVI